MKPLRSGFTLVELLVVIAIIGILMGLALPAVNMAREAARRSQCGVNIKNHALAAILHENNKGELPGWIQKFGDFAGGPDPSDPDGDVTPVPAHAKVGTWAVALLPFLEAQATYEQWSQDRYPVISVSAATQTSSLSGDDYHTNAAPNLAIFQCPSNPNDIADFGRNSYIVNNGAVPINLPAGAITFPASQRKTNGAFNAKYLGQIEGTTAGTDLGTYETGSGIQLDDFKDGQNNTVLFAENVQASTWHRAGLIDATVLSNIDSNDDIPYDPNSRYIHGLVWHYEDPKSEDPIDWQHGKPEPVLAFHKINGASTKTAEGIFTLTMEEAAKLTTPMTPADLARPSSAHTDGVNIGLADGSTRFITSSIDYRIYQAMLTPRGKSSDVPWPEFVLTDQIQ